MARMHLISINKNEKFYYKKRKTKYFFVDPHDNGNLLGKRIKEENKFWPLFCFSLKNYQACQINQTFPRIFFELHKLSGRDQSNGIKEPLELVFFIDCQSSFFVWLIHRESSDRTKLIDRGRFSFKELDDLSKLFFEHSLDDILNLCSSSAKAVLPAWVGKSIDFLSKVSCREEKVRELSKPSKFVSRIYKLLMRLEYSDNISELASAVKGMLSPKDYIVLLQLFNAFKSNLFSSIERPVYISEKYFYCVFRELFCLLTGKHIIKDPFDFGYLLSTNQRFMGKDSSARLISYRSRSCSFVEHRGSSWTDETNYYYLSNGTIIYADGSTKWGEPVSIKRNSSENFSKDSASSTQEWILCELNRPNQYYVPSFEVVNLGINPHKILFNTCTGTDNLGHIVWNEYSGADLLLSTLSQVNVPDVIEKVVVYLSSNYCSRFSEYGPRYYIRGLFVDKWKQALPNNILLTNSIENCPHHACVSIRSIVVSNNLPEIFREIAKDSSSLDLTNANHTLVPSNNLSLDNPRKFTLFLNIRTANKSCQNFDSCLEAFLELLKINDFDLKGSEMRVFVDYVEEHELI